MEDLRNSHLAEELQQASTELDAIPVILGNDVWKVYEISGGYNQKTDTHVLDLTVPLQKPGGSAPSTSSGVVEVHVEGSAWFLEVSRTKELDEDDGYTLRAYVTNYERNPHSFVDALKDNVDKRETRYSPDE